LPGNDISFIQLLPNGIYGLIRLTSDGVVGDHLKDHVDAPLEIQPEFDVVFNSRFAGKESRIGYNSPNTQKRHGKDDYKSLQNTFIHVSLDFGVLDYLASGPPAKPLPVRHLRRPS